MLPSKNCVSSDLLLDEIVTDKVLPVVEEELGALLDLLLGVDTDPVISIDEQDLDLTVWFVGVVREADGSAQPGRIHDVFIVEVEHVGALGHVVYAAPALTFLVCDHFSDILCDEVVFLRILSNEAAKSCNIAGGDIQLFAHHALKVNVLAGVGLWVQFQFAVEAHFAEVYVALPAAQEAGALAGLAAALAPATREPIPAVDGTVAELFAKVFVLSAGADTGVVAGISWVIAGCVG